MLSSFRKRSDSVDVASERQRSAKLHAASGRIVWDMASTRDSGSYDQLCPVATGTDAVGDRWTLLLLRDLAHAPLRFSELEAANPGISPSVLTKRLTRLEADGVIVTLADDRRRQKRYQLNPAVRERILAVLDAVSQLGLALAPDGPVSAEQLVRQLDTDRAWFLAKHHRTQGVFALHIDNARIGLVVDQHTFEPSVGTPDEPTAVITCSLETMLAITTAGLGVDDAIEHGDLTVDGELEAVRSLFASLSAPYAAA